MKSNSRSSKAETIQAKFATLDAEQKHRLHTKVWWEDIATLNPSISTSLVHSARHRRVFMFPGRIAWISAKVQGRAEQLLGAQYSEDFLRCTDQVTVLASKNTVSFTFTSSSRSGNAKALSTKSKQVENEKKETIVFAFKSIAAAAALCAVWNVELRRDYAMSPDFTPNFQHELNTAIRKRISRDRDFKLRNFYFTTFNKGSYTSLRMLEALFASYRAGTDYSTIAAEPFAALLSAVANDPVMLIFYLAFDIQLLFDESEGDVQSILFDSVREDLSNTVSHQEWIGRRDLLLSMFAYPVKSPSLQSVAVQQWATRYLQDNARQRLFSIDLRKLRNMLQDERYMCYACLRHHADAGDVNMLQNAFAALPREFLFMSFSIEGSEDSAHEISTSIALVKPHFIDFLFHPNLKDIKLFNWVLELFKEGSGYNDNFCRIFLDEAVHRDELRVAVKVLKSIMFDSKTNEPNVHTLKFCPRIPVLILQALMTGVEKATRTDSKGTTRVSDDARLLLEIALRFEYMALRMNFSYMKTISKSFCGRQRHQKSEALRFVQLLEVMSFPQYVADIFKHNMENRTNFFDDDHDDNYEGGVSGGANGRRDVTLARESSVRVHVNQWLDRSDEMVAAVTYGLIALLVQSNAKQCAENSNITNPHLENFFRRLPSNFYSVLMHPNSPIRAPIVAHLKENFGILSMYDGILADEWMFSIAEHFNYSVLHALSYIPHNIPDLMVPLMTVSLRLKEHDNLFEKLRDIDLNVGTSQQHQQQLQLVLHYSLNRNPVELADDNIHLQDLIDVSNYAAELLSRACGRSTEIEIAAEIQSILRHKPVQQWAEAFTLRLQSNASPKHEDNDLNCTAHITLGDDKTTRNLDVTPKVSHRPKLPAAAAIPTATQADEIALAAVNIQPLTEHQQEPVIVVVANNGVAQQASNRQDHFAYPTFNAITGEVTISPWRECVRTTSQDLPSAPQYDNEISAFSQTQTLLEESYSQEENSDLIDFVTETITANNLVNDTNPGTDLSTPLVPAGQQIQEVEQQQLEDQMSHIEFRQQEIHHSPQQLEHNQYYDLQPPPEHPVTVIRNQEQFSSSALLC